MDCFKEKLKPENPMIFMGKSMVSGEDFPKQTNPLICWFMFFCTWWLIPRIVSGLVHPSCKWINPTYPVYNWGYNPLAIRGMSHQVGQLRQTTAAMFQVTLEAATSCHAS